jgi:hypothetical protein
LGTRWWFARGEAQRRTTVPQWSVRLPERSSGFHALPLTKEAAEMLRPDAFSAGWWLAPDHSQRSAYYVEWKSGQVARFIPFLHNPTVCLPASGCQLVRELGEIKVPWNGGNIPFKAFIFRVMGDEFAVAFTVWDPTRGKPLQKAQDGGAAWWRMQWDDVKEARQHQPAQLLTVSVFGDKNGGLLAEEIGRLIVAPASNL